MFESSGSKNYHLQCEQVVGPLKSPKLATLQTAPRDGILDR
jgi:hypothetical protein